MINTAVLEDYNWKCNVNKMKTLDHFNRGVEASVLMVRNANKTKRQVLRRTHTFTDLTYKSTVTLDRTFYVVYVVGPLQTTCVSREKGNS